MKNIIKQLINSISLMHSTIYYIIYKIFPIQYKTLTIILSKKTGLYGEYIRRHFYERTLSQCGINFRIRFGSFIVYNTVKIGNNCTIEENCIISNCEIDNDVIIAANCSVMSGAHHHDVDELNILFRNSKKPLGRVKIGKNVWIGTHAVIMADIPNDSVVGAGAVVTKEFLPYSVIGGVPATLIRTRGVK